MRVTLDVVDVLDEDLLDEGSVARHALDLEHLRDLEDFTGDCGRVLEFFPRFLG